MLEKQVIELKYWNKFSIWHNIHFKINFLKKMDIFLKWCLTSYLARQQTLFNFSNKTFLKQFMEPKFLNKFSFGVISSSKFIFDQKWIFSSKWWLTSDLAKKLSLFEFSNKTFLILSVVEKQFMEPKSWKKFSFWRNIQFKIRFLTKIDIFLKIMPYERFS